MMGDRSSIEWTEATWNPIRGCSRVSEGCRNCYAERMAIRQAFPKGYVGPSGWINQQDGAYLGLVKSTPSGPRWTGKVAFDEKTLYLPMGWKKPRRVFVNSMGDLFHEALTDGQIGDVFEIMGTAKHHTYQVLTKRAERMRDFMQKYSAPGGPFYHPAMTHIWLGVSVEDQATADARIPLLLQTPAAVRWVSYEPALKQVDFRPCGKDWIGKFANPGLDWLVIGGESGSGARPFDVAWARGAIAQCKAAGVPVFVKQLGAQPFFERDYGTKESLPLRDRKGGDPTEWPEDLRVREYPAAPRVGQGREGSA